MSEYPTFVLSTAIGRLCAMAINRDTIRVTTSSYGPDIDGADSEAVVNGVVYQLSIHVHGPDAWHQSPEFPDSSEVFLAAALKLTGQPDWTQRRSDLVIDGWATTFSRSVTMTRADRKDPSNAAKLKAEGAIVQAIGEWVTLDPKAPAILARAEVVSLENERERADEALAVATKALRAAQDVHDEISERLRVAKSVQWHMAKVAAR